jgi:ketosteroid isomerase-like protein
MEGSEMINAGSDPDHQRVIAVTEEEVAAIEAGDADRYLALLGDDAVFMPPNIAAKTGDDLRQWLRDFLDRVTIKYLQFTHGEIVVRDDLACHAYSCSWKATPKSGGQPTLMCFKGMLVFRRTPDRIWKICRSIWNSDPTTDQL